MGFLSKVVHHHHKDAVMPHKKLPRITVPLPAGRIGLSFTGKKEAVVSSVRSDGPMDGKSIKIGYIAEMLTLDNGTQYSNFNKTELGKFLKDSVDDTDRTLTFIIKHNTGDVELDIPASEKIGFEIIETEKGVPIMWNLSPDSKHLHTVSAGMIIDTVILPNNYEMHAHSAEEFKTLLSRTSSMKGRKVIMKSKESKTLSARSISCSPMTVELPLGTLEKHGLTIQGRTAIVKNIDEKSSLKSEIYPGMIVAACRIPNGADYTNIPAYLLHEILNRTQKMEKRLIHLVGDSDYVDEEPMLKFFPDVLGTSMAELGITFIYNANAIDFNRDGKVDLAPGIFIDKVDDKESAIYGLDGLRLFSVTWRNPGEEESETMIIKKQTDVEEALLESAGCNRMFNFTGVEQGYMPDEFVTVLPPMAEGETIGCTFSGEPAQITVIEEGSLLMEEYVTPGMFVTKLTIDHNVYENPSAKELLQKLKNTNDFSGRLLKCVKTPE
mmetsp:Transcript_15519/g.23818  ORF Transcript_15519/g.23818 Transcript_15519/m.23818 type:complete len:495 (+) Transcript_15519:77-1561(+)